MTANKRLVARLLVLTACLAGIGLVRAADTGAGDDGGLAARVDRHIQAWQPSKAERRLDDIGWAQDIRAAERLAKEHNRPIFLFTYSGSAEREHAMALERC